MFFCEAHFQDDSYLIRGSTKLFAEEIVVRSPVPIVTVPVQSLPVRHEVVNEIRSFATLAGLVRLRLKDVFEKKVWISLLTPKFISLHTMNLSENDQGNDKPYEREIIVDTDLKMKAFRLGKELSMVEVRLKTWTQLRETITKLKMHPERNLEPT